MNNLIFFNKTNDETLSVDIERITNEKWNVLVVDDDICVHSFTRLSLKDFSFKGKALNLISAYSSDEAKEIVGLDNIALIVLNVTMEEEDSALMLVKYIREELNNKITRIVLKIEHSGALPVKKVVDDYDINDYILKDELTEEKLYVTIVSALRSYSYMKSLETSRDGLKKIIDFTSSVYDVKNHRNVSELISLLKGLNTSVCGVVVKKSGSRYVVEVATGRYENAVNTDIENIFDRDTVNKIVQTYDKGIISDDYRSFFYIRGTVTGEKVIVVENLSGISEIQQELSSIACSNIKSSFDNIYYNEEIESSHREIIFTLGEIAEARSKETGNHVKRVAEYCRFIALKYGLSEDEANLLWTASAMHDIGKIAVPDSILQNPGKLTDEEFNIMKMHTKVGYEMLKNAKRSALKSAAIISLQHHEKYNGNGYPFGLKGENIHIYGRITAVADVFDCLISDRLYKKAWDFERVISYFIEERGRHFDPALTDILLDYTDEFIKIRDMYADRFK
ncbi:MAG TPA: HD domain-containing phosphohydrolase [Clostridia bacterium]